MSGGDGMREERVRRIVREEIAQALTTAGSSSLSEMLSQIDAELEESARKSLVGLSPALAALVSKYELERVESSVQVGDGFNDGRDAVDHQPDAGHGSSGSVVGLSDCGHEFVTDLSHGPEPTEADV